MTEQFYNVAIDDLLFKYLFYLIELFDFDEHGILILYLTYSDRYDIVFHSEANFPKHHRIFLF